jgi:hypothetical protein
LISSVIPRPVRFGIAAGLFWIPPTACGSDSPTSASAPGKDATAASGGSNFGGLGNDAAVQTGGSGAVGGADATIGQAGDAADTGGATDGAVMESGGAPSDAGNDAGAPDTSADPNLFVEPIQGSDIGNCSRVAPCKTLRRALQLAKAGIKIYLDRGTYSSASGEDFTTSVPDGVTIEAIVAGSAVILGTMDTPGLLFKGSGAIRFVRVEAFKTCITASSGSLELDRVELRNCGTALALRSSVQAVSNNTQIIGGNNGYTVSDSATLRATGGGVSGLGPDCSTIFLIDASGTGKVFLKSVVIQDNFAPIELRESASAQVDESTFSNNGSVCGRSTLFDVMGSGSLVLNKTTIVGGPGNALSASDRAYFQLAGGSITSTNNDAIIAHCTSFNIHDTRFTGQGKKFTAIRVSGTTVGAIGSAIISNYSTGISVSEGANLLMLNSNISGNYTGIFVGFATSSMVVDLGRRSGGNNTIQNEYRGLAIETTITVNASGNIWNPLVQGTDAVGKMPEGAAFRSSSPTGTNFYIHSNNVDSQIAF